MTQTNCTENSSYLLATEDRDFLQADAQRGLRLLMEYQKPELILDRLGIASTIVAFGSARILSPEAAEAALASASTDAQRSAAQLRVRQARWYSMAREFGRIASVHGGALNGRDGSGLHRNVIATGGGPGLMEAANRGAAEAGAPSIGFTIELPHEERPNPYSTPELTFKFKYFGIRKMHLLLRCKALAVFPGGYGTLDELFEIANLVSCKKMERIPIVLFDREYWSKAMNLQALLDEGMISPHALELISFADSAEDGWNAMLAGGLVVPA